MDQKFCREELKKKMFRKGSLLARYLIGREKSVLGHVTYMRNVVMCSRSGIWQVGTYHLK